jgi:hypothetical protein
MLRASLLLFAAAPLFAQSGAALLARLDGIAWEAAPSATCVPHIPGQIDIYATSQWTHHCSDARAGIVRESFFYAFGEHAFGEHAFGEHAFGEPAREARLRVDLRPADESPETTARLLRELGGILTRRFGTATHEPAMFELGFRVQRFGQPVAGDHWQGGGLHYILHANQTNLAPLGMRHGAQLIVINDRLFAERTADARILAEDFDPVRARLKARIGAPFTRATLDDLAAILSESARSGDARRALDLVAADLLASRLSQTLADPAPLRQLLAGYGATLGGLLHDGGLDYRHELLWRAWNQFPQTEGGELAFLELQRHGWNTDPGEGCPANPDLFREVIERAENFLAQHPRSDFRIEVLYALAEANESWWSIARAPDDDPLVGAPPYPHRAANRRAAAEARERAIRYYRQVVQDAPESPRAAAALRRLPRLMLDLDTGQRLFYCSYC